MRYGAVRVCGHSRKGTLAHTVFELDPNYTFKQTAAEIAAAAAANAVVTETGSSGSGAAAVVDKNSHLAEEYVPTDKKYALTEVADAGDECVKITGIPSGSHVLTVKTDPAHPTHVTTVSHVIIF